MNSTSSTVQVVARVKPAPSDDAAGGANGAAGGAANGAGADGGVAPTSTAFFRLDPPHKCIIDQTSVGGSSTTFQLDKFYPPHVTNQQLFSDAVEPLVLHATSGYHVCVLGAGATGTGKTHTLFGPKPTEGVIYMSSEAIFAKLDLAKSSTKSFVTLSAFQIHGSTIVDLLNPNTKGSLEVHDHRSLGAYVDDLVELEIESPKDVACFLAQAHAVAQALPLRMPSSLAKPHTLVSLNVETVPVHGSSSVVLTGRVLFVDTAAGGNVALKFNSNSQALHNVINALSTTPTDPLHVPYASSILTRLLQPYLGGSSHTLFLNFIDMLDSNSPLTVAALELAERMRKIKNTAKLSRSTLQNAIRDVREEIKTVRGKLNLTQPGQFLHDIDPHDLTTLKRLMSELERLKSRTWEQRRTKSREMAAKRKETLQSEGLLYTLLEETELPSSLHLSSKALLRKIVQLRLSLEEEEQNLEEAKKKSLMRRDVVLRKLVQQQQHQQQEDLNAVLLPINPADVHDDKLALLERNAQEAQENLAAIRKELVAQEDEYKKLLAKIATAEARQRRMIFVGADQLHVERLNRQREMSDMRAEMEADAVLQAQLANVLQSEQDTIKILSERLSAIADSEPIRADVMSLVTSLSTVQRECASLAWEREALWARLIEAKYKHEVQMNRYQEHMFFMFRNYRAHFEEQKQRLELRSRTLLENAVKDALKLSEENVKLKALLDAKSKQI